MSTGKPYYNFSDPIFKMRKYIRWANEHIGMWELAQESDVISWEVKEAETPLNIPKIYTVEYRIRSIIGLDENEEPIYGNNHILELAIPNAYPVHPCTLYMKTNAWHPNIKSDGGFKGKICGNVQNFGLTYTLRQLVLRVGEILQYKNYHAEFIEPYPEDETVAKWVREVAEPQGIINLKRHIFVDDTPLLRLAAHLNTGNPKEEEEVAPKTEAVQPDPEPTPTVETTTTETPADLPLSDVPMPAETIPETPESTTEEQPAEVRTPKFVIQPKKITIKPK